MKFDMNNGVEVVVQDKVTGEVKFKIETQPVDLDVKHLSNVNLDDQKEGSTTTDGDYTVHTTDSEGVSGSFKLLGISLNPTTVEIRFKNSKGNIENLFMEKELMHEEEYKAYETIHADLS